MDDKCSTGSGEAVEIPHHDRRMSADESDDRRTRGAACETWMASAMTHPPVKSQIRVSPKPRRGA